MSARPRNPVAHPRPARLVGFGGRPLLSFKSMFVVGTIALGLLIGARLADLAHRHV